MLSKWSRSILVLILILTAAGCRHADPRALPPQSLEPSSQNTLPLETAIPLAFQSTDPQSRRAEIVTAIRQFLLDPAYLSAPDEVTSAALTSLAFSSDRLTIPDPAFVRRFGSYAVVAIPDGIGLYFYDLAHPSQTPLELSRWTVGIQSLEVVWQDNYTAIAYHTLDLEGISHAHVSLLTIDSNLDWEQSWIGDDTPDWWFNDINASIDLAPDLSQIVVVGASTSGSQSFQEDSTSPQRLFRLVWTLDNTQYQLTTPSTGFRDRSEWAWATAVPSPYATLVEFVERFQRNDVAGAKILTANDTVMVDADNFGLALVGVPYKAEILDETHIRIVGHQGALIIAFQPPENNEGDWLITSITPQGAVAP